MNIIQSDLNFWESPILKKTINGLVNLSQFITLILTVFLYLVKDAHPVMLLSSMKTEGKMETKNYLLSDRCIPKDPIFRLASLTDKSLLLEDTMISKDVWQNAKKWS